MAAIIALAILASYVIAMGIWFVISECINRKRFAKRREHEDAVDAALIESRRDEPTQTFEEIQAELRKHGYTS